MAKPEREVTGYFWASAAYTLVAGAKSYELSNHLGNVMAVISDRGELQSAQDFYPFGMAMPGRSTDAKHRYGFNGKETDPETGIQDYGMRWYLPNIARFPSVDPITAKYPELTPYQFASNTPIMAIDLDGLEAWYRIDGSMSEISGPRNAKAMAEKGNFAQKEASPLSASVLKMGLKPEMSIKVLRTETMDCIDNKVPVKITVTEVQCTFKTEYQDPLGQMHTVEHTVTAIHFKSNMDVCTDGAGAAHGDEHHMTTTAFPKPDGTPYNADKDNYIVLPTNIRDKFGVPNNALSFTTYQNQTVQSRFGETNFHQKIGEASWRTVGAHHFDQNPNNGGHKAADIDYWIITEQKSSQNRPLSDQETQGLLPKLQAALPKKEPESGQ